MTLGMFRQLQVTLVHSGIREGTKLYNFVSVLKFMYFPSRNCLFYIWDRLASIYLTRDNFYVLTREIVFINIFLMSHRTS